MQAIKPPAASPNWPNLQPNSTSQSKTLALSRKDSTVIGSWVSLLFLHLKIRMWALSGTSLRFYLYPPPYKKAYYRPVKDCCRPWFFLGWWFYCNFISCWYTRSWCAWDRELESGAISHQGITCWFGAEGQSFLWCSVCMVAEAATDFPHPTHWFSISGRQEFSALRDLVEGASAPPLLAWPLQSVTGPNKCLRNFLSVFAGSVFRRISMVNGNQ